MGLRIFTIVVIILIGLGLYINKQPSEFMIKRDIKVAAPPEKAFALVNDFHNWQQWSPWAKLDPNQKVVFEGKKSGLGAAMAWDGNNQVGTGRAIIAESLGHEKVEILLVFTRPMKATNIAEFTFYPTKDKKFTRITWKMSGHADFLQKAMNVVMNCEKMVGAQFDEGLANIKSIVEKPDAKK
jgi:hypothetical protein